jgi:uncharacterized protein YdaU (DUF1376 family)
MAEFPALPLWTDAYLADCVHLTAEQDGYYLRLLMAMWRAPRQRVPNDDAWLAAHLRCDVESIRRVVRPLISEFCKCDGNWVTQKRLAKEFRYLVTQRKKQSVRAKSRWDKEKDKSHGSASSGNAPTPTPTPTPTPQKEKKESAPKGALVASDFPPDAWEQFWERYPHKVGKRAALRAFEAVKRRGVTWTRLMAGLEKYIRDKPPDRAWCNPQTFLNQDRFDDKPAAPIVPNGRGPPSRGLSTADLLNTADRMRERANETPAIRPDGEARHRARDDERQQGLGLFGRPGDG